MPGRHHPFRMPHSVDSPTPFGKGFLMTDAEKNGKPEGFLPDYVRIRHPKQITYVSTALGAFFGSLIFVLLLNVGTGLLTQHCTVTVDAVTGDVSYSGLCSYMPASANGAQEGTHPEYVANLLLLAVVAFGARYVAQHLAGVWSQGDIDIYLTLTRIVKSVALKDEPMLLGHRLVAVICQGVGALIAIFFSWAILGNRNPYGDGGAGLGGPGLSVRGLQSFSRTLFFVAAIALVRGLVFLWSIVERKWTTQRDAFTKDRTGKILSYDNDTDHISTGLTHHARSGMLATVDGILAVVGGAFFGPSIGFFWRDVLSLAWVGASTDVAIKSGLEGSLNLYLIAGIAPLMGYFAACFIALAMIWIISTKYKGPNKKDHGN